jgi:hypothetical protein
MFRLLVEWGVALTILLYATITLIYAVFAVPITIAFILLTHDSIIEFLIFFMSLAIAFWHYTVIIILMTVTSRLTHIIEYI